MVLKQDGSVWTAGYNLHGQLGIGLMGYNQMIFVRAMYSGGKAVAAGVVHSMVLKEDGSVWTAGRNEKGTIAPILVGMTCKGRNEKGTIDTR